jgi:ATPase subunit of ABC transporter with duplicated ATPase domains
VLHDRYLIERLATRVVELQDGKLHECEPEAPWHARAAGP